MLFGEFLRSVSVSGLLETFDTLFEHAKFFEDLTTRHNDSDFHVLFCEVLLQVEVMRVVKCEEISLAFFRWRHRIMVLINECLHLEECSFHLLISNVLVERSIEETGWEDHPVQAAVNKEIAIRLDVLVVNVVVRVGDILVFHETKHKNLLW